MRFRLVPLGLVLSAALAMAAFAAPAGAKTKTKTFQNTTPAAISDAVLGPPFVFGTGVSDVSVTKKGTVKDVNVGVQITHPDTGDLLLYLFKDERYIELASFEEGLTAVSDANFGGGTGCTGGITLFDGAAGQFIYQGDNPFAGSFRPSPFLGIGSTSLAEFNGDKLKGTWRLLVLDADAPPPVETGTINCVQVTAKYKVE